VLKRKNNAPAKQVYNTRKTIVIADGSVPPIILLAMLTIREARGKSVLTTEKTPDRTIKESPTSTYASFVKTKLLIANIPRRTTKIATIFWLDVEKELYLKRNGFFNFHPLFSANFLIVRSLDSLETFLLRSAFATTADSNSSLLAKEKHFRQDKR